MVSLFSFYVGGIHDDTASMMMMMMMMMFATMLMTYDEGRCVLATLLILVMQV